MPKFEVDSAERSWVWGILGWIVLAVFFGFMLKYFQKEKHGEPVPSPSVTVSATVSTR